MAELRTRLASIVAVVYAIAFIAFVYTAGERLRGQLEAALYHRLAPVPASATVSIIAIDDASIKAIGPWPWSREIVAEAVDRLAAAGAAGIALVMPLAEAQRGPRALDVRELVSSYAEEGVSAEERERLAAELGALNQRLRLADVSAPDQRLATSLAQAGNVVLSVPSRLGDAAGPTTIPAYLGRQALTANAELLPRLPHCVEPLVPIVALGEPASRLGLDPLEAADVRQPLAVVCGGSVVPTLPLAIAAQSLQVPPGEIRLENGRLVLGGREIRTHADASVLIPPARDWPSVSFAELRAGAPPPGRLAGGVALIGPTAVATGAMQRLAATVAALREASVALRPVWAGWLEALLFIAIAAYLIIAAKVRAGAALAVIVAGPLIVIGGEWLLLDLSRWAALGAPALLLATGQLLALITVPRARAARPSGATTRRADPEFFAETGRPTRGPAPAAGPPPQIKRLGRYEITRDLGKGAMGVVYLGRDPNINRVVAIKAIPLAEEFEEADLPEVRARFFREAETAGRLNHPNIVTVYDAGEDGDIAFIAMEYLRGRHLSDFVARDRLLPAAQVLELGARVANALAYAHKQGVIHRDIKPANLMYDPGADELKITDFGIARLTDTSTTRTGIVLGTPSFMSPEQLEGKNVNGPSDLFSLGVTLYQLLSGHLPFRADSMTGLMFKIANEPHRPIHELRTNLPESVDRLLSIALRKEPEERFQSGTEMATALRDCAAKLSP